MSESESREEIEKVKRAPRKRVAKSAAAKTTPKPRKTAARKAPAKKTPKVEEEESIVKVSSATKTTTRKAPTVFASEKNKQKQRQTQFVVIAVILIMGVGASAVVGYTDKGQIDVAQVIEEQNQKVRTGNTDGSDAQAGLVEIPVQNTNKAANGGLVGLGTGGSKPKPPVDTSTSTASSTQNTASSTEAMASSTSVTTESASSTEDSASNSSNTPEQDTGSITVADTQTATSS